MRIIIVCGDPDCSEEYYTDSEDRLWTCPHCGREKANPFYPFLTVRLMHAKTAPDDVEWKLLHDELLERARRRVAELVDREGFLSQEVARLRGRLPEGMLVPPAELPDNGGVAGFISGWSPSGPEGDGGAWRALHDELLEGARAEVLLLETRVPKLEEEVRRLKSALGIG